MRPSPTSLIAENISLVVGGVPYLDDVSFTLQRGRLHTVIGRTLAGKTTLLRTIAGLEKQNEGSLSLGGEPFCRLPVWQRDVAMVYQQFINYPHLNVVDNVAFPLRRRGLSAEDARDRALSFIAKVSLDGLEGRRPSTLSGGQQQRLALARALARRAGILLLDEPLVNLDYQLREQMREEFRSIFADQGEAIVLYATTEPAEAMMLSDEILVLHEGRLLQTGTPTEVFERPVSMSVSEIVYDPPMSLFEGVIEDGQIRLSAGLSLPLAGHMRQLETGRYYFGLRPNEITITADGNSVGVVTFAEVSGSETFLYLDTDFGSLVLLVEGIHSYSLGARVPILIESKRLFVFGSDEQLVVAP